jgi:hypothetical protein
MAHILSAIATDFYGKVPVTVLRALSTVDCHSHTRHLRFPLNSAILFCMRPPLPSDAQILTVAKQALSMLHAGYLRDAKLAVAPLVAPFERAGLTHSPCW